MLKIRYAKKSGNVKSCIIAPLLLLFRGEVCGLPRLARPDRRLYAYGETGAFLLNYTKYTKSLLNYNTESLLNYTEPLRNYTKYNARHRPRCSRRCAAAAPPSRRCRYRNNYKKIEIHTLPHHTPPTPPTHLPHLHTLPHLPA